LYPPSDGYQPPEDPLVGVARQIGVVHNLKSAVGDAMLLVSSGLTYLQEFLPQVAQALVRQKYTDIIGVGRMVLSYPALMADSLEKGAIETKKICRTFSDCTTGPRNGLKSGCYPLDDHYKAMAEFGMLKEIKQAAREKAKAEEAAVA
jgi:2,4-dienoyl-CoA reductase-like NADH-dependent reductase (Old Yellow Enzyme family)